MNNWKISIINTGYKTSRDIYIFRNIGGGETEILGVGIIKEGEASVRKPTIELAPEQLQALADELNNIGYKPQKGYLEGKLEATEFHLNDTRKLLKLNE